MSTPGQGRARTQDSLPDEVFRQLPYGIVVVDDAGSVVGVEPRDDARGALALALRESFAELPDGQREVVVLRHVAGWSPAEIASRLGKTENSVHALHHRGRRALKASLTSRDAVPAAA